jgi:hypothetical protein
VAVVVAAGVVVVEDVGSEAEVSVSLEEEETVGEEVSVVVEVKGDLGETKNGER